MLLFCLIIFIWNYKDFYYVGNSTGKSWIASRYSEKCQRQLTRTIGEIIKEVPLVSPHQIRDVKYTPIGNFRYCPSMKRALKFIICGKAFCCRLAFVQITEPIRTKWFIKLYFRWSLYACKRIIRLQVCSWQPTVSCQQSNRLLVSTFIFFATIYVYTSVALYRKSEMKRVWKGWNKSGINQRLRK